MQRMIKILKHRDNEDPDIITQGDQEDKSRMFNVMVIGVFIRREVYRKA